MIIVNNKLLQSGHGAGRCEICGKWCRWREFHHIQPRGMGGGKRLDIPINLICVGSTQNWQCPCHGRCERKEITQDQCWAIVAKREGCTVEQIKDEIARVNRLDKGAEYVCQIQRAVAVRGQREVEKGW